MEASFNRGVFEANQEIFNTISSEITASDNR